MWNFLTFQTFITQDVLIIIYYIGAILIPVILWYFKDYLRKRFTLFSRIDTASRQLFSTLSTRNRILVLLGFFTLFLCMELCWRMMFEMMIGYFNMHNFLQSIASRQG